MSYVNLLHNYFLCTKAIQTLALVSVYLVRGPLEDTFVYLNVMKIFSCFLEDFFS